MYISTKDWKNYIYRLSALDQKAGELMQEWIRKHGFSDTQAMIDYAYAIAQKYGEGSAALAAEMYDAVAEMAGKMYPPAVAAHAPGYGEVAKTVNGILKTSQNPNSLANGIGRLVKRTGADTTLLNAERDGAEFAWVPNGDTCAFCIALASRGWQKISKKALKNGHAEHIHANCDCTYSIRFDGKSGVSGYDPQVYRDTYYGAEGGTPQERINAMRRMRYEQNREYINLQKREAYARNRRLNYGKAVDFSVDEGTIHARRVDKYGYNNIYIDESISLTERQLRTIDKQISLAKEKIGVTDTCNIPVVISELQDDILASYNPRTNIMRISIRMSLSDEEIKNIQADYACPDDTRSTSIHELLHWQDAEEYRQRYGEILDASENSIYSVYEKEKAYDCLLQNGIDLEKPIELLKISRYAYLSALDNDWEEVYTEFRTQILLEGGAVK